MTTIMKKNNKKLDVLAFGPHPDDVEFGCGGLLLKVHKLGYRTGIIDMSLAELSTNGIISERLREAEEARKILGAVVRKNLKLPNNFFQRTKEVQDKVIQVVRQYQPSLVLLPYWHDRHPDHEDSVKIIQHALFTSGLIKYKTGQKPHRPKYVFHYMLWNGFRPSLIIDITDEWPAKKKALLAYKSQFIKNKNRARTIDNEDDTIKFWEARARHYGFMISKKFGEPYLSEAPLGVNNPFLLLPNNF
jgi:bacillithiol biosynthesis deacetylase BshB1